MNKYIKIVIAFFEVLGMLIPGVCTVMAADGKFEGRGSDYEDPEHGVHNYSYQEWVEGNDAFGIVNILEIVPDERMGYIGYTIGGCEPLGDTPEEKAWIMDAMMNNSAGSMYDSWQNPYIQNVFQNFVMGTSIPAFLYEKGYFTGYYKKVEKGQGFYAIGKGEYGPTYDGDRVKNVVMVSKFGNNKVSPREDSYDYVWVESEKDGDGNYLQKDKYTTKRELEAGEPIYVYNHKKLKYLNNEQFLTTLYPVSVEHNGHTYTADGEKGAYNVNYNQWSLEKVSENIENRKAAEYYKIAEDSYGHKGVKIFTRTPAQLQLDENKDLIKNVDLIVLASKGDTTYEAPMELYKKRYEGTGLVPDENLNIDQNSRKSYTKYTNDLTFEQVKQIYDRVVVEKNLAIVCSHHCLSDNNGNTGLNIWKLMYMLFVINKSNMDSNLVGTGRDLFINFMSSYRDDSRVEVPIVAKARANIDSSDDFTELVASDIVRINETTGNFEVDDRYNGWLFEKLSNVSGADYGTWNYGGTDTNEWKASINQFWFLGEDEGVFYKRDGDDFIYDGKGKGSFPLYKYFACATEDDDGYYITDYKIHFPSANCFGTYENQMAYNDNGTLFKYDNGGGASFIKSTIQEMRPQKRVPDPGGHYESVVKSAFMTMNIVNGDSVNTDIGGNKIMYVNEYEVDPVKGKLVSIPFNFEVRTTHPIATMELYIKKSDGTEETIATYNFNTTAVDPFGNSAPTSLSYTFTTESGESGSGSLIRSADKSGDVPPGPKNPDDLTSLGVEDKVWKYEGTISELTKSYFEAARNATVYFKVTSTFEVSPVEGMLKATDIITVVKREFFELK